jgi:hypothetical protein
MKSRLREHGRLPYKGMYFSGTLFFPGMCKIDDVYVLKKLKLLKTQISLFQNYCRNPADAIMQDKVCIY